MYYFAPAAAARVTVSLCGSMVHSDAFDTKLYVLADLLAAGGRPLQPLACNDDFCGYQSQLTVGCAPSDSSSQRGLLACWAVRHTAGMSGARGGCRGKGGLAPALLGALAGLSG